MQLVIAAAVATAAALCASLIIRKRRRATAALCDSDDAMASEDATTVRLSHRPLDLGSVLARVTSPSCGAVATFVGTTRDTFNGRMVISLEYEAYASMAIKEMLACVRRARAAFPHVHGIAIEHKLGPCPVTMTSIVIAVASPHRKDALGAVGFLVRLQLLTAMRLRDANAHA